METKKTNEFTTHMFVGPYKFWYQSDDDYFIFEDFSVYKRFRYGYLLYYKDDEEYLACDEDYNTFCEKSTRQIALSKLS